MCQKDLGYTSWKKWYVMIYISELKLNFQKNKYYEKIECFLAFLQTLFHLSNKVGISEVTVGRSEF